MCEQIAESNNSYINNRCTVSEVPKLAVQRISESETFSAVACGFAHSIALTTAGKVYSVGLNHNGQLGLSDNKSRHVFDLVWSLSNVSSIYASGNSTACITLAGI